jgi:hypothetical protein
VDSAEAASVLKGKVHVGLTPRSSPLRLAAIVGFMTAAQAYEVNPP